jgi:hypothetical protein
LIFLKEINLYAKIYTSQQQKRYKGLMLNMFYIEKKIGKNRIIYRHSLCVGNAKLSLQEVITHVTELRKPPYCMMISGYVLF